MSKLIKFLIAIVFVLVPSAAMATTYYFSTSGDDSWNGTSHIESAPDGPKKTVQAMNATIALLSNGSHRILLKAGDAWDAPSEFGASTYLLCDKSGTDDNNRFVIGAYNGATGARLTRTDSFTRPIISGDIDADDIPELPSISIMYSKLIRITGNYVTVENLNVTHSTGSGIDFSGPATWGKVHNCIVSHMQLQGVLFYGGSDYGVAEYTTVYDTSLSRNLAGKSIWGAQPQAAALGAMNSSYMTVQYCTVYQGEGEGIFAYEHSYNTLIQYNRVYDIKMVGIYTSGEAVIRYNLVHGVTGSAYGLVWAGIAFDPEMGASCADYNINNIKMYGNLVANVRDGILLGNNCPNTAITGAEVYNNTVVDCITSQIGYNTTSGSSVTATIKNNAFIRYQSSGSLTGYYGTAYLTADYNFWTSTPEAAAFRGAHDIISPTPILTKTSGWLLLTSAENGSSFAPQIGSPLVDRVAGIASYTTLPLSGSTWPSAVTTGNATLEIAPDTPTLTSANACADISCVGLLLPITFQSSSFTTTDDGTNVDLGAIQLNYSGAQTHGYWQIGNSGFTTLASTTPSTNIDDASNKTSIIITAGLEVGQTYYWRVRYKDNMYTDYSSSRSFTISGTPSGSGGSVVIGVGLTGQFTLSAPGTGKGSILVEAPGEP